MSVATLTRNRWPFASLAVLVAAAGQVACGSSTPAASGAVDVRGSWDMVAVANGTQYPQTLHITSEDAPSGKFSGTDAGSGLTFTVTGSVQGANTTFVTTQVGGAYTSNATAKISGSGTAMTMAGTFTDSNGTSGTFTAKRTST